jgi:DNA-binding CsgD family transcriptional regulator
VVAYADPLIVEDIDRFSDTDTSESLERRAFLKCATDSESRLGLVLPSPIAAEVVRMQTPLLRRHRITRELADLAELRENNASSQADALRVARWRLVSGGSSPEVMLDAAELAHQHGDLELATAPVDCATATRSDLRASLLRARLLTLQGNIDDALQIYQKLLDRPFGEDRLLEVATTQIQTPAFAPPFPGFKAVLDATGRIPQPVGRGIGMHVPFTFGAQVPAVADLGATPESLSVPWRSVVSAFKAARAGCAAEALDRGRAGHAAHAASASPPNWRPWPFDFIEAESLSYLGDIDDSYRTAKDYLFNCVKSSDIEPVAWHCWQLSRLCPDRGFARTAVDYGASAMVLFGRLGRTDLEQLVSASLAIALAIDGRLDDAESLLDEIRKPDQDSCWGLEVVHARAWLAATRGNMSEAHARIHEGTLAARERNDVVGESQLLHSRARMGDPQPVVGRLKSLAEHTQGVMIAARADHAQSLADGDPQALERNSTTLERLGAYMLAAESSAAAASLWRRRASPDRAAHALARSSALLDRCERPVSVSLESSEPTSKVSRAERAVAELALSGLSNREIADRLSVSRRTVENQLHQVYRKLGITSRGELPTALGTGQSSST